MLDYEECRKIIKNPEFFIIGRYGLIVTTVVLVEIFIALLITLVFLMNYQSPSMREQGYY